MDRSIFGVTILAFDSPIKTSAFFIACSRESISLLVANSFFSAVNSFLSDLITPLLSVIIIFLGLNPKALYILVQEIAAAPAPHITIWTSLIFFSTRSKAFKRAAEEIIAVPC